MTTMCPVSEIPTYRATTDTGRNGYGDRIEHGEGWQSEPNARLWQLSLNMGHWGSDCWLILYEPRPWSSPVIWHRDLDIPIPYDIGLLRDVLQALCVRLCTTGLPVAWASAALETVLGSLALHDAESVARTREAYWDDVREAEERAYAAAGFPDTV